MSTGAVKMEDRQSSHARKMKQTLLSFPILIGLEFIVTSGSGDKNLQSLDCLSSELDLQTDKILCKRGKDLLCMDATSYQHQEDKIVNKICREYLAIDRDRDLTNRVYSNPEVFQRDPPFVSFLNDFLRFFEAKTATLFIIKSLLNGI